MTDPSVALPSVRSGVAESSSKSVVVQSSRAKTSSGPAMQIRRTPCPLSVRVTRSQRTGRSKVSINMVRRPAAVVTSEPSWSATTGSPGAETAEDLLLDPLAQLSEGGGVHRRAHRVEGVAAGGADPAVHPAEHRFSQREHVEVAVQVAREVEVLTPLGQLSEDLVEPFPRRAQEGQCDPSWY